MFSFLTGDSIHSIALVSRRLYDLAVSWLLEKYGLSLTDYVTVSSADALRALGTAMVLSAHRLQGLNYRKLPDDLDGICIHCAVVERFIRRFGFTKEDRIRTINLDFGPATIWTSRTLLSALCGHSHEALFVCGGEIHTVTGTALLTSPNTSGVLFLPRTLDVTYPICTSLSPARPWTMIIVDAQWITTLRLSSNNVWSAILPEITLPNLQEVAVWSRTIPSVAFTAFLNRHGRTITTLRYLSVAAQALPLGTPPLRLPLLQRLTCPAHYIVHIFPSATRTAAPFPRLTEVAVRSGLHTDDDPDLHFFGALRLLAAHARLRKLSLRLQLREQVPAL
ncbi:hypothetical protein GGX14DRAFT_79411 [Mycena pura]|uniref:F-box domain-containing protein n=1 Tax=Mycena pura TaxID=153505 RepID=A0AAD6YIU9_9AGAR|nr:hypothetical protein GGX14DRAFT_79411 [Mycena pura]